MHGQTAINNRLFSTYSKTGGHTYMSSSERGRYIALPTKGSIPEIFNVSVLLHDSREREDQLRDVWDAVLYVTEWLESKGPKATLAQSARVKSLKLPGNTHHLNHGPMLSLLVCMYLSAIVPSGISIVMETYGGKTRETVRYVPNCELKVSLVEAKAICNQFKNSMNLNAPFMVSRFSTFCEVLSSNKFFSSDVHSNNNLKWGIGSTVQTKLVDSSIQREMNREHEISERSRSNSIGSVGDNHFLEISVDDLNASFVHTSSFSRSSSLHSLSSVNSVFDTTNENINDSGFTSNTNLDNSVISSIHSPSRSRSSSIQSGLSGGDLFDSVDKFESIACNASLHDYVAKFAPPDLSVSLDNASILRPAFTVINVIQSSLLKYCSDPNTWFMDSKGNKLRERMARDSAETISSGLDSDDVLSAENDSNGLDTEESENSSSSAIHRHSNESNNLHRFLPLSSLYSDFVTFPIFGGILPLQMQPANHTRKGRVAGIVIPGTVSERIFRVQQYSVLARNAFGECGVPLKSSVEMAHYELDIFFDKNDSIYNMDSLKDRRDRFEQYSKVNLETMSIEGNPARVEIAFESIDPGKHDDALLNGIMDTIQIVLNSTESYSAVKCAEVIKFSLDGTLSRLHTLQDMMRTFYAEPTKNFELYHIRTETAARLHTFYSGRGTLKNMHLFSPKNSYMAGRPTHKTLMPLSYNCREKVLKSTVFGTDLWNFFIENLVDVNGKSHHRIDYPEFQLHFVKEIVNDKYVCGRTCSKCWMIFATEQHIRAFECHDCVDIQKGKSLLVTDQRFVKHHDQKLSELNDIQIQFINDVRHDDKDGHPPNIFITGGAGSGKTHVLKLSIANTLYRYGMNSFVVLAYTKMAASLVNGMTYHSFLGMSGNKNNDGNHDFDPRKIGEHLNGLKTSVRLLQIQSTLRIIYIDEVGMLSNQQLEYLDQILKHIKNNRKPFGGIQIILCGDVLQLPPIMDNKVGSPLIRSDRLFFFHSDAYQKGKFETIYLEVSYRQKDKSFLKILNRMREGNCTKKDCDIINSTWGSAVSYDSASDVLKGLTTLYRQERRGELGRSKQTSIKSKLKSFFKNDYIKVHSLDIEVLSYNFLRKTTVSDSFAPLDFPIEEEQLAHTAMTKLALDHMLRLAPSYTGMNKSFDFSIHNENIEHKLVGEIFTQSRNLSSEGVEKRECLAEDFVAGGGECTQHMKLFLENETKTEECFVVYVGMRVLFTANETSIFTSNNTMGNVQEIKCSPNGYVESITVTPCVSFDLIPHPVVVFRKLHVEDCNGTQLTRYQFPLKAADCGNAFTTQGCSLSIPVIYNSSRLMLRDAWARVYVAASRVTDKKYFFPLFPLKMDDIKANPVALNFDREIRLNQRRKRRV
jgi:hypothetical protein